MSHPAPDRPHLGPAGPSQGAPFLLVMAREAPLSLEELAALREAAAGAPALPGLRVDAIEGFGKVRVRVGFDHPGTRWPEAGLTELPPLLHALARAVPKCKVRVRDPAGLLSWTGSRFSLDPVGGRSLPGVREGYAVPESAVLAALVSGGGPAALPSAAAACAADVLEAVGRGGLSAAQAASAADVDDARLRELVEGRVLPASALRILAARGADTAALGAALARDGDATERAAAGAEADAPAEAPPAPELAPGAVIALGRVVLARPGLGGSEDEAEDDDLLLLDEDEEDADPIGLALADLAGHETVRAAAGVADADGFPRRLLDRLAGFNDSATGACLLLCLGAWSGQAVPGVSAALQGLVEDAERPWALRALALRALARAGRPDARAVLLAATADADVRVAGEALGHVARLVGTDARAAVRTALDRAGTRVPAAAAAAAAADRAALDALRSAAADEDFGVRAAVADALPRVGGSDGLPVLRTLADDPSWEVRRSALRALARLGDGQDVARATEGDDAEILATVVATLGEADRTDAWPRLLSASRHARPAVRAAAARALAALGLPAATPHLSKMVSDANPTVRVAALRALGVCGDRRGVHALRRHAGAGGSVGDAATEALHTGRWLRRSAPDGRVRVRVLGPLEPAAQAAISRRLSDAGLTVSPVGTDLDATGALDPDDVPRLSAVRAALQAADDAAPGLAWSVRDGQYALRRLAGRWIVSARRGGIVRDAGWFDDPLPVPGERPALEPLPRSPAGPSSPMAMAPLPVSVMRHVTGRKQVVAAADPHRPYDPDEITGEVPIQPALPDEAPDPDEVTGETAAVRAAQASEPADEPAPEEGAPSEESVQDDAAGEADGAARDEGADPDPLAEGEADTLDEADTPDEAAPADEADDVDTLDGAEAPPPEALGDDAPDDAEEATAKPRPDGTGDAPASEDEAGPATPSLPPAPPPPPPPPAPADLPPPADDDDDDDDDDDVLLLDDDLLLDGEYEVAPPEPAADPETEKVAPVAAASDWDDLISERRGAEAIARIAARGLTDAEKDQLVTWLGSGLPGIQRAAAGLAGATREPRTFGPLVALLAQDDAGLRATAATALGRLGDPAALEHLEPARADEDPEVAAAAAAAIDRICGLADTPGEE